MKNKQTIDYQFTLRAIGQGLQNLDVKSFELKQSDDSYLVSGNCRKTKTTVRQQRGLAKAFLRLVRNVDRKTSKTSDLPFHFSGLRFGPSDIEHLDQKGKALRSSWEGCSSNPHGLAQLLRMTGAYLDHSERRLLRLSWSQPILTVWYVTNRGVEVREQFTPPDLYDLWVHQFKKRKPSQVLKPTGSD